MQDLLLYGHFDANGFLDHKLVGKKPDEVREKASAMDNVIVDLNIKPIVVMSYDDYRKVTDDCILGVAVEIVLDEERTLLIKLEAPNRHDDIKTAVFNSYKKQPEELGKTTYGFYSVCHRFLDRKDAMKIALRSGQVNTRNREHIRKTGQTELQSVDLW